jgi:pilus assembly protein Flp/PilA
MLKNLSNVITNEDGATLVEYGLLVALIAGVSIAIIGTIGTNLKATFTTISGKI